MPDSPTSTTLTDSELLELIAVAPWHRSPGYDSPGGYKVGTHEYLVRRDSPELFDLLAARIKGDGAWFGRFPPNPKGRRYRYLTLADGLTYWQMNGPIINRDQVDRAARESQ